MTNGVTLDETTARQQKFFLPVELREELLKLSETLKKKKTDLANFHFSPW